MIEPRKAGWRGHYVCTVCQQSAELRQAARDTFFHTPTEILIRLCLQVRKASASVDIFVRDTLYSKSDISLEQLIDRINRCLLTPPVDIKLNQDNLILIH